MVQSHFIHYQNDERALPLMHSFREKFLEVLGGTADNPSYSPPSLCLTCNKELSINVVAYCIQNKEKFKGQLYYFNHQKLLR